MGANANFCAPFFDYFLNLPARKFYRANTDLRPRQTRSEVVAITTKWMFRKAVKTVKIRHCENGKQTGLFTSIAGSFFGAL
ncbi:hypothetical protein [Kalamiella sp. sgz302252]|uniref:hypothetical protein n=1 Tax=Pantoea sp. sgz302252 TaxID=3341827 RepID=UPI0036D2C647